MWSDPPRDGSLSAEVAAWTRRTRFELVRRLPLPFATHHPQGMAFIGGRIFLSTVEILESPTPLPGAGNDPAQRTPGAGNGHVLVLEPDGTLVADVPLGEGDAYHPGGIDSAGGLLWVPVAEYRADSRSLVYAIDPATLEASLRFTVDDHVSWLAANTDARALYGGSWGSRRLYSWSLDGVAEARTRAAEVWENPSHYIDFQDVQQDGGDRLICGGIAELRDPRGEVFELGGIAVVHVHERRLGAEVPVPAFSAAGHTVMRNPFVLTRGEAGTLLHTVPDDGGEGLMSELLTYRVVDTPRSVPPNGVLTAVANAELPRQDEGRADDSEQRERGHVRQTSGT